jgi:hypothetical protein
MVLTVIVVGGAAAAAAFPGITCGAISTVVLKENHPQPPAWPATSNNKAARITIKEARIVDMTASPSKVGRGQRAPTRAPKMQAFIRPLVPAGIVAILRTVFGAAFRSK